MSIKKLFCKLFKKNEPDFYNQAKQDTGPKPLKEYTLFDLMDRSIIAPENIYVPVSIKMFEDKCCFEFNVAEKDENGFMKGVPHCFEAEYTPGRSKIDIVIENVKFTWDDEETFFRWIPYGEGKGAVKFNNWIEYFENGELRIHKDYADNNLSPEAIQYAYYRCDDYYSWNVWDGSYAPIMFAIPTVFYKTEENACFEYFAADMYKAVRDLSYTGKYVEKKLPGYLLPMMYAEYQKNEKRVLWEPISE